MNHNQFSICWYPCAATVNLIKFDCWVAALDLWDEAFNSFFWNSPYHEDIISVSYIKTVESFIFGYMITTSNFPIKMLA